MIRIQLRYLPNLITCVRFFLIVPILWALLSKSYSLAFYLFLLAGLSDALDGLLARVFGWTTHLGALLDPLADKLLLMGSFIVLACLDQIPGCLTALVIGRDIWIMGGALIYRYKIGPLDYKPILISKLNTLLQLVLVTLLIIKLAFFALPDLMIQRVMDAVFVTTLLSFIQYTWVWGRHTIFYLKKLQKRKNGIYSKP